MKNIDDHVLKELRLHIAPMRNIYNYAVNKDLRDDGTYLFRANHNPVLAATLQHIQPHLPRAELLTLKEDPTAYNDSTEYILHPDLIKYIDPDVYTIRELAQQFANAYDNDDVYPKPRVALQDTGIMQRAKYFTPKMLKNLLKVPNKERAINELVEFFQDNEYRIPEGTKYDSLGSVRRAIEQYQERDEQKAHDREVFDDILENLDDRYSIIDPDDYYTHPEDFGGIPDPLENILRVGEAVYDLALGRYVTDQDLDEYYQRLTTEKKTVDTSPYKYSDDVKNVVGGGWRLFESPEDQKAVGRELGHCYGDFERYGDRFSRNYTDKIRGKKSILLTKGNVTAEIALDTDNKGTIVDARIVQIKGPNNTEPDNYDQLHKEVDRIALDLLDKNVNQLEPEQIEQEISDIICKHLIKTTPASRNIISALHRRF